MEEKTKPFRTIKDFGEEGDNENILNLSFGLSGLNAWALQGY